MSRSIGTLLMAVLCLACDPVVGGQDQQQLPRSILREVDETLLPALQQNDLPTVAESAATLIRRAGASNAVPLNDYLAAHGMPDCGTLLLEARMAISENQTATGSRTSGRTTISEGGSVLRALDARLLEFNSIPPADLNAEDFLATEPTFRNYASFLRDIYRTGSVQQDVLRLSKFAIQFIETESRLISRIRDPELKTICRPGRFEQVRSEAEQQFEQLMQTELKVRWQRLQTAGSVLAAPQSTLPDRFAAAFAARLDAEYLPGTLSDLIPPEDTARAETLQQLSDQAREDAGELWDRSYRFTVGLDWWRRGRFGRGQYGGGMMKGFDALLSLDQQIALQMPEEFPEIAETSPVPVRIASYPLSRRHKYQWQIEPPKGREFRVRTWFG